ncbi:MAG: hypothetical protein IH914_00390 [candidate division Zixibacteria bacterium]|nr:hypothetical protein [candidate division Zixibacteria bacterium]
MCRVTVLASILALTVVTASQAVVPPLINYQGELTDNTGNPLNGSFDFTFRLYNQPTGGAPFWTEIHPAHVVTNGAVNVILGTLTLFSTATPTSNDIWLGITVGTDPELSPRTRWVSVPFAFEADRADTAQYAHQAGTAKLASKSIRADTAGHAFGIADNTVDSSKIIDNSVISADIKNATILGADIAQNTITGFHIAPNVVSSVEITNGSIKLEDFSDMGATDGQIIKFSTSNGGPHWTVANPGTGNGVGGWTDGGTIVRLTTIDDSVGIGTTTPSAKLDVVGDIVVSGKATIGPGQTNTGLNAFVAGENNTASTSWATISGGRLNVASGDVAPTIGGGQNNTASAPHSTVGGGFNNTASNFYSTVAGGTFNRAESLYTTVSGGLFNLSTDTGSSIGGGANNRARGAYSVIAGVAVPQKRIPIRLRESGLRFPGAPGIPLPIEGAQLAAAFAMPHRESSPLSVVDCSIPRWEMSPPSPEVGVTWQVEIFHLLVAVY